MAFQLKEIKGSLIALTVLGGPVLIVSGLASVACGAAMLFLGLFDVAVWTLVGIGAVSAIAGWFVTKWAFRRSREAIEDLVDR
ncbi:MAG: hypothetical protein VB878_13065 [Pirellulaceae bacterium]